MPVLNANVRAFNLYAEPLKWPNLYFIPGTCICISFSPEQGEHCRKQNQLFLSCFFLCPRSTSTLHHWFADEEEGQNRKRILGWPNFVFPSVLSVSSWLMGRYHRKGSDGFHCWLYLRRISLPSLLYAFEVNGRHGLSELLAFTLTHYTWHARLVLTLSLTDPCTWRIPQNSVLLEYRIYCTWTRQRGTLNTLSCVHFFFSHAWSILPLHVTYKTQGQRKYYQEFQ